MAVLKRLALIFFVGVAFGFVLSEVASENHQVLAQAPASPGQPQAASGSITILVNGVPVATGGTINVKSGNGVIASATPDVTLNGTDIKFDADTAVLAQAAPTSFAANSGGLGLKYSASTMPATQSYIPGSFFVMVPDVPTQAQATLDLGPGPVLIQGTCSQICLLLAYGSPVKEWVAK